MSNTTQLKRGWSELYAVTIEGIPYVFVARIPKRVDSTSSIGLPTGYVSAADALTIETDQSVSITLDRQSGGSSGTSFDLTLDYDSLSDASLLAVLFKQATNRATLTADLAHDATTITVDDTTGCSASGSIYLGRELVTYTGTTGTSFTGCTRGVGGYAYKYQDDSPTYRVVSDIPIVWRGRFVTIHAHLVSPEGRILDSQWTTGTYHREIWKGQIESVPQPIGRGFRFRTMPLVRTIAKPIGSDTTGNLYAVDPSDPASFAGFPVGDLDQSVLVYLTQGSNSGSAQINPFDSLPGSVHWLGTWGGILTGEINSVSAFSSLNFSPSEIRWMMRDGAPSLVINWVFQTTDELTGHLTISASGPYFLEPGTYVSEKFGVRRMRFVIPIRFDPILSGYIPVKTTTGSGYMNQAIPSAGFGILETDTGSELIKWSDTVDNTASLDADLGSIVMLQISARGVNGTGPKDLNYGGTFSVTAGYAGTVTNAIRTVLQSSGTGARGTYDTLSLGFGYGIPEAWIDETAGGLGGFQGLSTNTADMVAAGRVSLEELAGGYLVLNNAAITQQRSDDGVRLALVSTSPPAAVDQTMVSLEADDAILSRVEPARLIDAPNIVTIDTSGLRDGTDLTAVDLPRVQAEGPNQMSISAPGITVAQAGAYAQAVIALGDGLQSMAVKVGAWVELEPGDPVEVKLAHPAVYDFAEAERAPSSVAGRVVGSRFNLADGTQDLTILIRGAYVGARFLCPAQAVQSKDSTTQITMTSTAAAAMYKAGETITVYNRGQDTAATPEKADHDIDTISGAVITITGSTFAAWVGAGTRVTYPVLADCSTRQDDFAFYDSATGLV